MECVTVDRSPNMYRQIYPGVKEVLVSGFLFAGIGGFTLAMQYTFPAWRQETPTAVTAAVGLLLAMLGAVLVHRRCMLL